MNIDQNNEIAQSELAIAYESSGRDPLDIYQKRYDDNPVILVMVWIMRTGL
ncbi:MAG: hypothetical protein Ct9H300mP29_6370 [Candidatus Neomarinimicrobiota bacterium]|nr:MAG: hypothetical protein Ct9H300mP29_6370 [Candidatus Neomarinimicrobiota bacterium]